MSLMAVRTGLEWSLQPASAMRAVQEEEEDMEVDRNLHEQMQSPFLCSVRQRRRVCIERGMFGREACIAPRQACTACHACSAHRSGPPCLEVRLHVPPRASLLWKRPMPASPDMLSRSEGHLLCLHRDVSTSMVRPGIGD